MKRGTPDHPKLHDLAARLGLPQWGAVGILESLWHFAQGYAQAGDIGRHTDEAIARAIGWEEPAERLIEALVASRWLDRCPGHRLRVHDWQDHADQTVERWLVTHGQWFLDCYPPASTERRSRKPAVAVAVPCRALPGRMPEPEPAAAPPPPADPPRRTLVVGGPPAAVMAAAMEGPRKNPLLDTPEKRRALERECLQLVQSISETTGEGPEVVMALGSEWNARRKMNPAAMTDDRLLNTVLDLRKRKAGLEEQARKKSGAGMTTEESLRARGVRFGEEVTRERRPGGRGLEGQGGPDAREGPDRGRPPGGDPPAGQDGARSPPR